MLSEITEKTVVRKSGQAKLREYPEAKDEKANNVS